MSAILIAGHGSRKKAGNDKFIKLVSDVAEKLLNQTVDYGFLELAEPDLMTALNTLKDEGHQQIRVLPAMLFAGAHVLEDIPEVMSEFSKHNPDITLSYGQEMARSGYLFKAAGRSMQQALMDNPIRPSETHLMMVGRGSSEQVALDTVADITRRLFEEHGFKSMDISYMGLSEPLFENQYRQIIKAGHKNILLMPLLLFPGLLTQRIEEAMTFTQQSDPSLTIHMAPCMGNHPEIIEHFISQASL